MMDKEQFARLYMELDLTDDQAINKKRKQKKRSRANVNNLNK